MVLKQFGVVNVGDGHNQCITITATNLVTIYCHTKDNSFKISELGESSQMEEQLGTTELLGGGDSLQDKPKSENSQSYPNTSVLVIQKLSALDIIRIMNVIKSEFHAKQMQDKSIRYYNQFQKHQNQLSHQNLSLTDNKLISKTSFHSDLKKKESQHVYASFKSTESTFTNYNNNSPTNSNVPLSCIYKENIQRVKDESARNSILSNIKVNVNSDGKQSQICISSNSAENNKILLNVFEGIDADALFDDF